MKFLKNNMGGNLGDLGFGNDTLFKNNRKTIYEKMMN